MSGKTKVTVSAGELAMAMDKNIILTKRAVTEKASALFSSLIPSLNEIFLTKLLQDKKLSASVPKIAKGENYKGFPYVIMDYPASFEKGNIFAVRTMFWWGNFISITLHISGEYKRSFADNIFKYLPGDKEFYIAAGDREWEHHFEKDNYVPFYSLTKTRKEEEIKKDFMKIALHYELQHWNNMQSILPEGYKKINALLNLS